ncbi:MAG: hypothetical protein COT43_07030 [Candidatus Marinimicrobia bacterium CG08_land_8_20_14_0_20_45_22]|nr:MAG: hypothetical protein COT43_07030 [Candidatus Marinimicrobia bacterium CG08_land_8_20_14_0_20_45_22]
MKLSRLAEIILTFTLLFVIAQPEKRAMSPDGKWIAYTIATPDLAKDRYFDDIWLVPADGGVTKPLTTHPENDYSPRWSPDGKRIAFISERKGKPNLFMISLDGGEAKQVTFSKTGLYSPIWSKDGLHIICGSRVLPARKNTIENWTKNELPECNARSIDRLLFRQWDTWLGDKKNHIFLVDLNDGSMKHLKPGDFDTPPVSLSSSHDFDISPDGETLVYRKGYNHRPYEIYSQPTNGEKPTQLTWANREFDETFDLPQVETFRFPGANGDTVHGFLLRPPHFDPEKKYPVILTIHGGPQNMWGDRFMLSWFTMQLITSPGYVGVFINPRGSTGYSSTFREEVSRDYGGKCFEDLVKGLDFVIAKYGFIDKDRQAVIGGSFGGYSVNWLMGHTNRFKCAVSHAGLYNLTSFFGATEELWFPAWDMGTTPWDEPELYDKWSPHRFAKNFRTPTLVTQGELDFRVPVGESLQLFTALQRQGIPSRLVIFPDEGHEILGLQNNVRWWKEMHRWLAKYLN